MNPQIIGATGDYQEFLKLPFVHVLITMYPTHLSDSDFNQLSFEQFGHYLYAVNDFLRNSGDQSQSQNPYYGELLFDCINLIYRQMDLMHHPAFVLELRAVLFKALNYLPFSNWDEGGIILYVSAEASMTEVQANLANPGYGTPLFFKLEMLSHNEQFWSQHPSLLPHRIRLLDAIGSLHGLQLEHVTQMLSLNHLDLNAHF